MNKQMTFVKAHTKKLKSGKNINVKQYMRKSADNSFDFTPLFTYSPHYRETSYQKNKMVGRVYKPYGVYLGRFDIGKKVFEHGKEVGKTSDVYRATGRSKWISITPKGSRELSGGVFSGLDEYEQVPRELKFFDKDSFNYSPIRRWKINNR